MRKGREPPLEVEMNDTPPQMRLQWRRDNPGNDLYFHALDPENYGRVAVVNMGQEVDSLGSPSIWWWKLNAPGVYAPQMYPGLKRGGASTAREAAAEAEESYSEFFKWIDPEEREYWYLMAEIARGSQNQWSRIHRKHYDD